MRTGPAPRRRWRRRSSEAKINPEQIGYINAHGTSTELGDLAETKAVKTVFGAAAKKVQISLDEIGAGHSLGASGGIELVITALALTTREAAADDQL